MSVSPLQQKSTDAITLIEREIYKAENERRPISRQMLADMVHASIGIPVGDAFTLVDQYCEEKAPGVPGYLAEEFAIPYLKVIAVLNVIIGVGALWYGIGVYQKGLAKWPWWVCSGTIFIGLGVLFWVQSLEKYAARRAKKQA